MFKPSSHLNKIVILVSLMLKSVYSHLNKVACPVAAVRLQQVTGLVEGSFISCIGTRRGSEFSHISYVYFFFSLSLILLELLGKKGGEEFCAVLFFFFKKVLRFFFF